MALSQSGLEGRIVAEMQAAGATAEGDHSWVNKLAKAISKAVIEEIQANAKAKVTGGSSAGDWSIE